MAWSWAPQGQARSCAHSGGACKSNVIFELASRLTGLAPGLLKAGNMDRTYSICWPLGCFAWRLGCLAWPLGSLRLALFAFLGKRFKIERWPLGSLRPGGSNMMCECWTWGCLARTSSSPASYIEIDSCAGCWATWPSPGLSSQASWGRLNLYAGPWIA